MSIHDYFANQIKWEKDEERPAIDEDYVSYKCMEVSPRYLESWVLAIKELEELLPPRFPMVSRGIGNNSLDCSFCHAEVGNNCWRDMACFVRSSDSIELSKLFRSAGVRLHFRSDFKSHPQVKISACPRCEPALECLDSLIGGSVYGTYGSISIDKLAKAKAVLKYENLPGQLRIMQEQVDKLQKQLEDVNEFASKTYTRWREAEEKLEAATVNK